MKMSAIGWTDSSGGDCNFVTGCTPVSAGCANCYAAAIYRRFDKPFDQVQTHAEKLKRLARARFPEWSPKRGPKYRPMAFVVDTGDLFHEDVSGAFVGKALGTMAERSDVTWQILTKRPERMRRVCSACFGEYGPPPNIWLGVTAENQATAEERIPLLLATPAAVRFISVEPMLEPVDLWGARYQNSDGSRTGAVTAWKGCGVDWVSCGGESGPNRRPFHARWALSLLDQCRAAGVPFFYKQGSGPRPGMHAALPEVGKVKEWPEEAGRG